MKTLFLTLLLLPHLLQANYEEDFQEYWTLVPGIFAANLIRTDSSVILISREYGKVTENIIMRNTINLHHFDMDGVWKHTRSFNVTDIEWISRAEVLETRSRDNVFRLRNGRLLVGGHGKVTHTDKHEKEMLSQPKNAESPKILKEFTFESTNDDPSMVNPMIFTFNPSLDSLLRIDTLKAVPYFGAVTLLHEVAPDTLIIGFKNGHPSNHKIMETDSLFNIRWSTEFGGEYAWISNICDFEILADGNYLISMMYQAQTGAPHHFGKWKNILFKFDSNTGKVLWQDEIWKNKGMNSSVTLAPWQEDKIVIALDDCCENLPYFNQINFHKLTGMHLQIRDKEGSILQEKFIADFLRAYVYVHEGTGGLTEDPDNAYPWFIPYRIIRNPDQTYLVTGVQYSSHSIVFGRGFLIKLDQNLDPLWARIFEIDKRNYWYGYDNSFLFNVVSTEENIYLGGSFVTYSSNNASPYYPQNYPWEPFFRMDMFITLDEHGCYEPGCHLVNQVPYYHIEQPVTISPNPARDRVRVNIDDPALAQSEKVLFISNMQGKGMLTKRFTENSLQVSLADFAPGTYLLYIMCEGQVFRAEKLVVQQL